MTNLLRLVFVVVFSFLSQADIAHCETIEDLFPKDVLDRIDARQSLSPLNASDDTEDPGILKIPKGIPDKVDWRSRDTEIQKQKIGNCTAFAVVAGIENLLHGKVKLSENHLWNIAGKTYPRIMIDLATKNPITLEKYWPIKNNRPYVDYKRFANYKLLSYTYLEDDIPKALEALADGNVLVLGFLVTSDVFKCRVRPSPTSPVEKVDPAHAVEVVGYDLKEKRFLIKNSWGPKCGEKGYQYIPFSYCQVKGRYCMMWSINSAGE